MNISDISNICVAFEHKRDNSLISVNDNFQDKDFFFLFSHFEKLTNKSLIHKNTSTSKDKPCVDL